MITNVDELSIQNLLADRYGIEFLVNQNYDHISIRPVDLALGEGFVIRITSSWRSLICEFLPDNYANILISTMGNASADQKELFLALCASLKQRSGIQLQIKINKSHVDIEEIVNGPDFWRNIQISLKVTPFVFENMNSFDYDLVIAEWGGKMLSLVLPLIPMEIIEDEFEGKLEGALSKVEINKYERNLVNRQTCLLFYGNHCQVCGFSFESQYGVIGKGFIHVHHVTPVSMLGENYRVNPIKDLIPVCPNCHSMLHKKNPPYSIEELTLLLRKQN